MSDHNPFLSPQTRRLLNYARDTYHARPEFLWQRLPYTAVLRRPDTDKWVAVVFRLSGRKLGLLSYKLIEFVDLRSPPELITHTLATAGYYPGYHMNKRYWYTIILDNSVSDSELWARFDISYDLATK